jgi:cytochrome c-type biogenesis protein CcmH/NrfG
VLALNSLGNYYQRHYPNRSIEAKNLFIKANQIDNTNQLNNFYGLGISAFAERDYQQCINNLEQVYKQKVFNNEVSKCLTLSYYALGNFPKAFFYAKKGMEYDSTNISNQYNYAVLLTHTERDNVNKVCHYFNKAVKSNPKDLQTAKEYAQYLNDHQKYKEAISIIQPFYKTNISDIKLNKLLAFAYVAISDYKSAINYAEFINMAEPKDFEAKKQLAFLILNVYMGNKEQYARGSGLIKTAVEINPQNAEAHVLYAYYMATMTTITKQQNMPDQSLKCKKIAREQYLLAKRLDGRMYDAYLEDFIK